jgi:hypothetical protein
MVAKAMLRDAVAPLTRVRGAPVGNTAQTYTHAWEHRVGALRLTHGPPWSFRRTDQNSHAGSDLGDEVLDGDRIKFDQPAHFIALDQPLCDETANRVRMNAQPFCGFRRGNQLGGLG